MTHEERNLRQKRAAYLDTADAILNAAENENRSMTDKELRDFNGLLAKVKRVDADITAAETSKRSAPTMSNGLSASDFIAGVGFSTRGGITSDGPFPTFGEQLQSVYRAADRGAQPDPRLFTVRAASGMNESVPSEGGFLVQTDFSTRLLDRVNAASKVASRCQEVPISAVSNGTKLPRLDESSRADGSRHGGVLGYWLAEAAQITGTKPKLATTELNLKKVAALVYSTDELLADSATLGSYVSRVASAELAWQVDNRIIAGSGIGCPLGIRNAPATIEVPKEAGQVADTVIAENVLNMYSRLPAASVDTAVWYVSQSVFPQLYGLALIIGLGGVPIFVPAGGPSGSPVNRLLGLPVIPIEHAAKLGDKGDVMLCDMSRYLLATKGGVQSAASIHVLFDTDQMVFRFIMRVDGQPDVPAPMTPWNGGPTESPFLVLASR